LKSQPGSRFGTFFSPAVCGLLADTNVPAPFDRLRVFYCPAGGIIMKKAKANEKTVEKEVYSIEGFCEAHDISRAHYFNLRKAGKGPDEIKLGRRKLITLGAAARWRKWLESQSKNVA
jgi:hypothetical protein